MTVAFGAPFGPFRSMRCGQSARQGHNRLLHSANAVMCQKQTFRHSFDYLVSESEQRRRKFQTDRLCRLEVDYK